MHQSYALVSSLKFKEQLTLPLHSRYDLPRTKSFVPPQPLAAKRPRMNDWNFHTYFSPSVNHSQF